MKKSVSFISTQKTTYLGVLSKEGSTIHEAMEMSREDANREGFIEYIKNRNLGTLLEVKVNRNKDYEVVNLTEPQVAVFEHLEGLLEIARKQSKAMVLNMAFDKVLLPGK